MKRNEVEEKYTWDLRDLFATEEDYEEAIRSLTRDAEAFAKKAWDLTSAEAVLASVREMEEFTVRLDHIMSYASLDFSVDMSDSVRSARYGKAGLFYGKISGIFTEFENALKKVPDEILLEAAKEKGYYMYLTNIVRAKKHALPDDVEKALTALSPVLGAPMDIYEQALHADLRYDEIDVDGKNVPMSFVAFENEYQVSSDTALRRKSFEAFSRELRKYENVIAAAYNTQVQKEKILATMRGFDSVIDALLFEQRVDRELYDRQIDTIMEKLAPVMRRYATLVKRAYGLDEMTFADLKAPLMKDFAPTLTIEESKAYVDKALSVMGKEYMAKIENYLPERFVDYVQNEGKTSGGFCSSPYRVHPYILLSWTGVLGELFTLVHELGHGAHFALAQEKWNLLATDISTYLVESPSTFNEMLLSHSLLKESDDPKFRAFVLSSMIENTYYHNFVTHLLEAHYQREVYKLVDAGEVLDAAKLSELKRATLEKFWGDAVVINEGAELTWMRQSHYYMGLYSYTYSAGLTVSTVASENILKEGEPAVKRWLEFLRAGGTDDVIGLAKIAGVDITTDKPLLETITHLDEIVTELESMEKKF